MSGRTDVVPGSAQGMPNLADAHWFPVDIHVPRRECGFLPIGHDVLERSTFLDTRMEAPLQDAVTVSLEAASRAAMPAAPVAWLFHTSFCCSTLLARMLHIPPFQVALKEPLVLRRLADARHANWQLDGLIEPVVRLLARPWDDNGAVVIKPTHAALNIAVDLLGACPESRAVILTSSLNDFLISNLKKSAEIHAKIPTLAERALQAGSFQGRLSAKALAPPDLIAAAALQWAAQRELCTDVTAAVGPQRLRILDATAVLDDPLVAAWQCAQWLRLPVPREVLEKRVDATSHSNAKALDASYSADRRSAEMRMIRAQYGDQISAASRWFDRMVLPAMRVEAFTIPEWQDL
ncbi:MAG: hypothetical protein H0T88_08455 [Lysobacter sp.]|nr:hypothetical protein [Lysobacter sp.]